MVILYVKKYIYSWILEVALTLFLITWICPGCWPRSLSPLITELKIHHQIIYTRLNLKLSIPYCIHGRSGVIKWLKLSQLLYKKLWLKNFFFFRERMYVSRWEFKTKQCWKSANLKIIILFEIELFCVVTKNEWQNQITYLEEKYL